MCVSISLCVSSVWGRPQGPRTYLITQHTCFTLCQSTHPLRVSHSSNYPLKNITNILSTSEEAKTVHMTGITEVKCKSMCTQDKWDKEGIWCVGFCTLRTLHILNYVTQEVKFSHVTRFEYEFIKSTIEVRRSYLRKIKCPICENFK